MTAQANGNSRAHPVNHAVPKKPSSNIAKQVSPLVNGNIMPTTRSHNHTRTPVDAAAVNTTTNAKNETDHVTLHS